MREKRIYSGSAYLCTDNGDARADLTVNNDRECSKDGIDDDEHTGLTLSVAAVAPWVPRWWW